MARPPHLALLRALRRARRPLAAAGPLPGIAKGCRRAPHLAHERRSDAAFDSFRLRLRVHWHTALAFRVSQTFDSLDHLEQYRGHFLNWYDTRTLKPLLPRYVSTVDSGNFAGSLFALRQGCLGCPRSAQFCAGSAGKGCWIRCRLDEVAGAGGGSTPARRWRRCKHIWPKFAGRFWPGATKAASISAALLAHLRRTKAARNLDGGC